MQRKLLEAGREGGRGEERSPLRQHVEVAFGKLGRVRC